MPYLPAPRIDDEVLAVRSGEVGGVAVLDVPNHEPEHL